MNVNSTYKYNSNTILTASDTKIFQNGAKKAGITAFYFFF